MGVTIRNLTEVERERIKLLNESAFEMCLIEPTWTGLDKNYMDATVPVRNFLKVSGVHSYEQQGRGAKLHGVHFNAALISADCEIRAEAHFYKPSAKPKSGGDPRIWFSLLHKYVQPNDILAIGKQDDRLVIINITKEDIKRIVSNQKAGPLLSILQYTKRKSTVISNELLNKLRTIAAKGLLQSVMQQNADTAIGRTIEDALGIKMNSSKNPDYKGIEIKSARLRKRKNRDQLFCKVPHKKISKMPEMIDILNAFGYQSTINGDTRDRLNVTLQARKPNEQGLYLQVDQDNGILNEVSTDPKYGSFASWYLSDLHNALIRKHKETFWINAETHQISGREHFELKEVIHTKNPVLTQFDLLLSQGDIQLDHIMKRLDSGIAKERGPSFKIKPNSKGLLFPNPQAYII